MCFSCYKEHGSPRVINDAVKAAVVLIEEVYTFSCVGGNLHCELDDFNIDNEHFEGEFSPFDSDVSEEQLKVERACYEAMKKLSVAERATALALYDGWITVESD